MKKRALEKATLLYVALPWFIFTWGWLQVGVAAVVSAALLAGIAACWFQFDRENDSEGPILARSLLIVSAVLAILWSLLAWGGGFGGANLFWLKEQSLLSDLIYRTWPIGYFSKTQGNFNPLVSGLGYQLPAALAGIWLGWKIAQLALFFWTVAGAFLSLVWLVRIAKGSAIKTALLFIFLGGLDWVGDIIYSNHVFEGTHQVEGWTNLWTYLSNTGLFFSVPSHALIGWVVTGFIFYSLVNKKSSETTIFLWALTPLWSLPVAVGLLPFVAGGVFLNRPDKSFGFKLILPSSIVLLLLSGLYYFSRTPLLPFEWLPSSEDLYVLWPKLVWFYLLEFGLFLFLFKKNFVDFLDKRKIWFGLAVGLLILGPLVAGDRNDYFLALLTIPSFFIFWAYLIPNFLGQKKEPVFKIFALIGFVGMFPAFAEFSRSFSKAELSVPSLLEMRATTEITEWPHASLLGHSNSLFFRSLSRKISTENLSGSLYEVLGKGMLDVLEAEKYENRTRANFRQNCPWAREKMIVDNGFGGEDGDSLEYTFVLKEDVSDLRLTVLYATELDGAVLRWEIDGQAIGSIACPSTREWWTFKHKGLDLGGLKAGSHKLVLIANGVNINIDAILISKSSSGRLSLEAEQNINVTRVDHVDFLAKASGGKIINNGFGASSSDTLEYQFNWADSGRSSLIISYATKRSDAFYEVRVDGKRRGSVHLMKTDDWGVFQTAEFSLGLMPAGNHTLSLVSNGANVNFDALYVWGG